MAADTMKSPAKPTAVGMAMKPMATAMQMRNMQAKGTAMIMGIIRDMNHNQLAGGPRPPSPDGVAVRLVSVRGTISALFMAAMIYVMSSPARASEHADAGHGGGHGDAGGAATRPYDPTLPRTFELGDIYIRNFRPTHNEIANVRFTIHVVFAPGTSDAVMAEMEQWRRRLRDQAITAARSAEPDDLSEPGLERVQRLMLLRIRRLPLPQPITGVYLTDFAVGSG
jgi:hypothetical protein